MQSILAEKPKFDEKLISLSREADLFEGYSAGHSVRIAEIVDSLGLVFNFEPHDRLLLQQAALVRNVGEMQMNRDYIRSGSVLSPEERLDLERHPVIGEQAAAKMGLSRGVQLIVRWHHEWWNGSGYPDGLEGEQIPLAARILRVADTYSALVADRPFRGALTDENARKYLIEWAAIEFDPTVVKAFLALPAAVETVAEVETYARSS
ncbi:MAG: HD domain-containing protein [Acidobacteria bacterium]|nr:HD domain-containing protein [Acidobacteriota bacterium]